MQWQRKLQVRETLYVIYNRHFAVIIFIIAVLAVLYYGWKLHIVDWIRWFDRVIIFEFLYDMHGSLFIIAFIYAAVVFRWKGVLLIWLMSMAVALPRIVSLSPDLVSLTRNIFYSLAPIMVISLITLELNSRKKERQVLAVREAEHQEYMLRIIKAQEDERKRLAQELHDDAVQRLLIMANRAQIASDDCIGATNQVREKLGWLRDAALQLSNDLRRLSIDLRPSILDNMGLVPAIRWLVDRLNQEGNIDAQTIVKGRYCRLKQENEAVIFRIVQEALTNVRRHSEATKARVTLESREDKFIITVRDNGKGFYLPKTMYVFTSKGKLGLIGMQQKARFLDGSLQINTTPGKGTIVSLEFSVNPI